MLLGGERYLCRIPVVEKVTQNSTAGAGVSSAEEEEKELTRVTDRGWELLQGMKGNCIYYLSGWWSYSFCYNKEVKQFHQLPPGKGVPSYPPMEDTHVQSYVLGKFPKKDGAKDAVDDDVDESVSKGTMELAKLQTKGETRYMVQKLAGGTTCDLTGKERKIEVQVSRTKTQYHVTRMANARPLTRGETVSLQSQLRGSHWHDQGGCHVLLPHGCLHPTPL
jgi:protein OS-9